MTGADNLIILFTSKFGNLSLKTVSFKMFPITGLSYGKKEFCLLAITGNYESKNLSCFVEQLDMLRSQMSFQMLWMV